MTYEHRDDGLWLDTETGELLTPEAYALHVAALNAANAFAAYDRARLDMEAINRRIEEAIASQFPEFAALKEAVAGLKKAYEEAQELLRTAAPAQYAVTGTKTFYGGAVGVSEVSRKTHYDAKAAHDWAVEMNRLDLLTPNEKAMTELAKAKQLPDAVMKFETVLETRLTESKLSALVQGE